MQQSAAAAVDSDSGEQHQVPLCWLLRIVGGDIPPPRAFHSAVLLGNNKIFMFGGQDGKKRFQDAYMLLTDTLEWLKLNIEGEAPPLPRCGHSCVALYAHSYGIIFGGENGINYFNDVQGYDVDNNRWLACKNWDGPLPKPRAFHSMNVRDDNGFVIFGGHNGFQRFNDLWVATMTKKANGEHIFSWERVSIDGIAPAARAHHVGGYTGGRTIVFGGVDGTRKFGDLHFYDSEKNNWQSFHVVGTTPAARWGHSATITPKKTLIVVGGYDGNKYLNEVWVLDTEKKSWQHKMTTTQDKECDLTGRDGHSTTLVGNTLFIFGGYNGEKRYSDLKVLDIDPIATLRGHFHTALQDLAQKEHFILSSLEEIQAEQQRGINCRIRCLDRMEEIQWAADTEVERFRLRMQGAEGRSRALENENRILRGYIRELAVKAKLKKSHPIAKKLRKEEQACAKDAKAVIKLVMKRACKMSESGDYTQDDNDDAGGEDDDEGDEAEEAEEDDAQDNDN